jgi:hypothetical protein
MANHSKERAEAEARFKKVQKAQRAAEGSAAMSEYMAAGHAVRAKTARLRELRLASLASLDFLHLLRIFHSRQVFPETAPKSRNTPRRSRAKTNASASGPVPAARGNCTTAYHTYCSSFPCSPFWRALACGCCFRG